MPTNPLISMSPTFLWLIAGSILCLIELFFPTAFVTFMMGVSALLVAVLSLIFPQFSLQVILWLLFSITLIFLARRFFTPRHRISPIEDAKEAETMTEILPGKPGRVLYEGNSWRAICADEQQAIAPHQKVYIVERRGNTLLVLPENILKSS